MFTRHASIALVASFLAFAGCTAQAYHDDQEDPSTFTASESALSSYGRQLVGDYKSDAVYPRFSLLEDGTYTFDTGIRCVRAPCPSGDSGNFSIWRDHGGRRYVRLLASDHSVKRWLLVESLKPVTLVGFAGITGTFRMMGAAGGCTTYTECGEGEQCIANVCTPRPVCATVLTTDGVFHAKNFNAGSFADADAWASTTAAGAGHSLTLATCTETKVACPEPAVPTCAFVSGTEAGVTYASLCDAKHAVLAAAGDVGEAIGVTQQGACTADAPYCSSFLSISDDNASFAYYAHTFGSEFEANAWSQLHPGSSKARVRAGNCSGMAMCPRIYKPVCGGVKSDPARTFSNQCGLEAAVRADAATNGWSKGYGRPGACE
jgi:hypothetical protein